MFTPLHRALGASPGPLDEALLDEAISVEVPEASDLDWKKQLPPQSELKTRDIDKDIAAMANSGGGLIIYGVTDNNGAAGKRAPADKEAQYSDSYRRTLLQVAYNSIYPCLFGVKIEAIAQDPLAVAVIVPSSTEVPHMVQKNGFFHVPVRYSDQTRDLAEREIEAMYRTRFEQRRRTAQDLDDLYLEARGGCDTSEVAWLIAVAHPRLPGVSAGPERHEAEERFVNARETTTLLSTCKGNEHPLEMRRIDAQNARPGLRRWTVLNSNPDDQDTFRGAFASVHHDGSVTLAAAVGGFQPAQREDLGGSSVLGLSIEGAIADFMALLRVQCEALHQDEYDLRAGIEWDSPERLHILSLDPANQPEDCARVPIRKFTPVKMSVNASSPRAEFQRRVNELAENCINQGGASVLTVIKPPAREGSHPSLFADDPPFEGQRRKPGMA